MQTCSFNVANDFLALSLLALGHSAQPFFVGQYLTKNFDGKFEKIPLCAR
jgi:hypothetical protein